MKKSRTFYACSIREVKKEPISSSLLSDCVSAGDAGQVEGGRLWGKTGGERENPGLLYGPHEGHQDPHCTSQRPTGRDHRRGNGIYNIYNYLLSHKLFDIFSSIYNIAPFLYGNSFEATMFFGRPMLNF